MKSFQPIIWINDHDCVFHNCYWISNNTIYITPGIIMSSYGYIFRVTGHFLGELTYHRWIPLTKASDAEFWCFFGLGLNKLFSKPSRRWFKTPLHPLWRHCNGIHVPHISGPKFFNALFADVFAINVALRPECRLQSQLNLLRSFSGHHYLVKHFWLDDVDRNCGRHILRHLKCKCQLYKWSYYFCDWLNF